MRPTWRTLTIDQHFPDAPFITFDKFNPEQEVQSYLDAGLDSAHVYTKCHWGHSYYDTRFGLKHPRMGFDMSAEMVPRLKAANIEAVAYFCYWFETRTSRDHPEWRVIGRDGKPAIWRRWHGDTENYRSRRWGMVCPSHPGYRAQCLDQIEEIFTNYPYDALFLDIIGEGFNYKFNCFCEHCLERYRSRGIDPEKDRLGMVRAWRDFWAEVVLEAKERMLRGNPHATLSLNGGPLRVPWKVLQHVDWPYTEGGENAHNPVILRGCGLPHPQAGIGAGPSAYDDWSGDRVLAQTATVTAHGNRTFFFYMTGRDPDGVFADHKFNFLERINEETLAKQPYLEGTETLKSVGVYHSEATLMEAASRDDEGSVGRRLTALIDRLRGMSMPCEFVPEWRCRDDVLGQFRMMIVSQLTCLSDGEIATFERYVNKGGILLVAGESGTRREDASPRDSYPLHDLLGIRHEGLCSEYAWNGVTGYVPWVDHPFFHHLRNAEYNLWFDWPRVVVVDAEVIAPVISPVAVETDDNYMGWFPLPPGEPTGYAALTAKKVGNGMAIYSVSPLTWFVPNPNPKYDVDVQWPTALLRGVIDHLRIDPGIRLVGSTAVEAVFHQRGSEYIVHLLNRLQGVPGNQSAPVHDVAVHVDRNLADIGDARIVYPREMDVSLQHTAAGVSVSVPPVEMHTILVLGRSS